jgi:hypothetical protein
MESQLNKTRDTIRRYDADADHASTSFAHYCLPGSSRCVLRSSATQT